MPEPLEPDMFDPVCPSALTPIRVSGSKWSALVLRCLEDGPRRFHELRVPIRTTAKVLTRTLRALERDGFVSRSAASDRGVEYSLTGLGRGMLGAMAPVCEWTSEHWDELVDAHEAGAGR
ncbi:helix-turn-helix domain-containing protein [Nocardiopsis sp. NPDC006139]|uniref:winged helix-turn-helix transcriptional regulator n=1 Tax=Nocardiopsis TaxID=2013 RepID=UPI0033BAA5D2